MASPRLRAVGSLVIFFAVAFLLLQFARPRLTHPPVTADLQAPPEVKAVLTASCYNCHSNETKVPWFDQIVPAYWLVVHDARQGRAHLNFSHFGELGPAQQKGFLYESVNQIQLGFMPPANYLLVHPGARVTPQQLDVLKHYLHPSDDVKPAAADTVAAADAQYRKWIAGKAPGTGGVAPAPNGLAFFPDYANWKPVSTTERYDNGTLRIILGNDVAQQAITSGNVHPWPDGAAFAKIAYKQQPDDQGTIWTGGFIQVEFMLKDAHKYKATEGWGFGRWRGVDHTPYGKNANFTVECTSCHRPMQANDFVYTMPIQSAPGDAFNAAAALPDGLPWPPLQGRVITSLVDHARHTMSTLYGNDIAVAHARTSDAAPAAGSTFALVTWEQQEDRHWFGGRIPGKVRSVEYVFVKAAADGTPAMSYEDYEGAQLRKADNAGGEQRMAQILGLRAAVMP